MNPGKLLDIDKWELFRHLNHQKPIAAVAFAFARGSNGTGDGTFDDLLMVAPYEVALTRLEEASVAVLHEEDADAGEVESVTCDLLLVSPVLKATRLKAVA